MDNGVHQVWFIVIINLLSLNYKISYLLRYEVFKGAINVSNWFSGIPGSFKIIFNFKQLYLICPVFRIAVHLEIGIAR